MALSKDIKEPEWGNWAYWKNDNEQVFTREEANFLERYVFHISDLAEGIDLVIEKLNKINERLDDIS